MSTSGCIAGFTPTVEKSPSAEIDYACRPARPLLKESTMRTTIQALLCSVLATACAPVGEHGGDHDGPDAGVDGGTASGSCDNYETRTLDLTVSGTSSFTGLPAGCWRLNGKLTLSGPAITSLAKLGDLREVKDLIVDGTALTKFDTKSAVTVSGAIVVKNNSSLADIANIKAASTVSSVDVEANAALTGLGGLNQIGIVAGATTISNNAKLATIDLGHATRLEGGITIADNLAATSINLDQLQSTQDFTVRNNGALTSLGSLAALHNVHGTFTIDNNDNLASLENTLMTASTVVDYTVVITGNAKLAKLGGITHMQYVTGSVTASNNGALSACEVRTIDCCVDTGQIVASGNASSTCNTTGYSWCYAQNGVCPYM